MDMKEVFIISATRTAIGKYGGTLRNTKSRDLASLVIKEAIKRATIEPDMVQEVIMGEVRQSTEAGNMARLASLSAGVPEMVPAFTVNRLCASAMQALNCGFQQIRLGEIDVAVAGGSENMSQAAFYVRGGRFGDVQPYFVDSNVEAGPCSQPPEIYGVNLGMGQTAENVAEMYGINREDQDIFSLQSQQRAAKAIEEKKFAKEIVPVQVKGRKGVVEFAADEFPRPETTMEELARLKPIFKKEGGTVTAGNACGRNDGASAVVLMSGEKMDALRLKPLGRVVAVSTVGVSPKVMGIGPVPAVKTVLEKAKMRLGDIDLIELNEAFAAQALAVIRQLDMDVNITNVNGGAIALGHPLGATGTRLIVTLLHEMAHRKARYGLATLCIGGGQGMATIVENLQR